ncbi:hypothetical protein [Laspinema palackyanum]|uniref:hypothetical protein n=1 Tax=Laspinema palackyanum TaxID=3231601 RepID=UPI00345C9D5B|nr:hypothetical protein [Laspinema sp. D2c]
MEWLSFKEAGVRTGLQKSRVTAICLAEKARQIVVQARQEMTDEADRAEVV